ncbi:hypothetical protein HDF16_000872 [Granulicella aggregans]|uniref:Uncharacterized protein n=1 Tax=Granulicella aggregans TaxID=474949 RepID=A0A7W7ZAG9_9BACT|nr:hypothetical protein [Granulicella aggregans]
MFVAITLIIAGCAVLAVATFGKNFSVGDADAMTSWDRPRSRWSRRPVSLIAGLMLLGIGIKSLISN